MEYFLMVFMSFASSVKSLIQGKFGREHMKNNQDALLYNTLMFAATALIFVVWFCVKGEGLPSWPTVLLASVMGLCETVFQLCFTKALSRGSVSLTAMINNFYLLFPILFGALVYGERVTAMQGVGVILFGAAMVLTASPENGKKNDIKWLLMALACMSCSGIISVAQKFHQHMPCSDEGSAFIVVDNLMALVTSGLVCLLRRRRDGEKATVLLTPTLTGSILLVGLILGGYHLTSLYLNGVTDSVIMYPILSVTNLLFTALWSVVIFKDRLTLKKGLALLVGTASIVLINLR